MKSKFALDSILDDEIDFDLWTTEEQAEYVRLMEQAIGDAWTLTPHQMLAEAIWGKVDWLLYGGAAGGGKSELACHHVNRLSEAIPGHHSLIVRQTIPELRRSLILRLLVKIKRYGIRARYRKLDGQTAFSYANDSLIECGHCATDEHLGSYLSAEYDCICIDEASQLTPNQITMLSSRLRTTKEKAAIGARPHLGLFTNPGDRAHAWLYEKFVVPTAYGDRVCVFDVSQGWDSASVVREYQAPCPVRTATPTQIFEELLPWIRALEIERDERTQIVLGFVPARASDNTYIDPSYEKNLNAISDEKRRRQMKDGDWETFDGQFFNTYSRSVHVIEPFDIPQSWQRARGLDYGSANPYSCHWGAWDPANGDCYIYREDYGAMFTPREQARRVVAMSVDRDGNKERYSTTVADPSVFANHRGVGKAVADLWRDAGLHVNKAKNARVAGWANFRQYLWDPEKPNMDGTAGGARLFIFSTCTNLIRTLPQMLHDKNHGEDLDTDLEDHAVDSARYLLMTRPLGEVQRRKHVGIGADARWGEFLRKLDKKKRKVYA